MSKKKKDKKEGFCNRNYPYNYFTPNDFTNATVKMSVPDGLEFNKAYSLQDLAEKNVSRKNFPVYTGVIKYFPDALMEVSRVSRIGNEQHHAGEPLHWDKSKSKDHLDALMRHLLEADDLDDDGILHLSKVAWRALAALQEKLEKFNVKKGSDFDADMEAQDYDTFGEGKI